MSLEHRYFGVSKPFGATDPVTQQKEFSYLTLDSQWLLLSQYKYKLTESTDVMSDASNFLQYLKKNVTGAEDSKAIVYSGNYDPTRPNISLKVASLTSFQDHMAAF